MEWEKIDFAMEWYFNNITGSKESGVAYATASKTGDVLMIAEMRNKQAKIIYRSDENNQEFKCQIINNTNYLDNTNLFKSSTASINLGPGLL